MPNVNKAILVGRLTRDPALSSTRNGSQICRLTIAVNRKFTSSDGQQREEADFFDVIANGRQADICSSYLHKGEPVYIEGRMHFYEWQDKSNITHKSVNIIMEKMEFLAPASGNRPQNPGVIDPAVNRAFQGVNPAYQQPRSDVPPAPVAPLTAPAIPDAAETPLDDVF